MLLTPPASPQLKGVASSTDNLVGYVLPGTAIELRDVLGIGAYGTVYVARDLPSGVGYAVKALNRVGLTPRQAGFLEQEIRLHRRASSHPNVVTLVDVVETPETIFVILEYCPEGDLFGNITERSRYVGNDALAKRIFLQLLDAVEYCHSIGVYHRDLKPENILITDGGMTAKLADFGLACTETCSSDFGCGSTFYMSPECLQPPVAFSCYSSAANDVWALGICLINLTCGRNPWKRAAVGDATFAAYLQDAAFLPTILPLSHDLDWILRRIFECDPKQRVTIPELRHLIARCPRFTTTSREGCESANAPRANPARACAQPRPPISNPPSYQPRTNAACHQPSPQQSPPPQHQPQQQRRCQDYNPYQTPRYYSPAALAPSDPMTWNYPCPVSPVSLSPASSISPSASHTTLSYQPQHHFAANATAAAPQPPAAQQQQQQQQLANNYFSASPGVWYSTFMMPALDLAQKHLSFQPPVFPGMRFA